MALEHIEGTTIVEWCEACGLDARERVAVAPSGYLGPWPWRRRVDAAGRVGTGCAAMMNNEGDVVAGIKDEILKALDTVTPSSVPAASH